MSLDIREWVQSHLPKNDALGFSSFLVDSLKELLSFHSGSLASVKDQLEVFYEELESLQPFLKGVAEQGNNEHDEIIHNFAERVIDKAYEVEYIIDSFVVGDVPLTYLTEWLSEIIREIKLIRAELTRYREKKMTFASPASNEELVGFDDVRETIMGRLLRGSRELDVVSIVGMAGSGKTTLARSLKNDPIIVSHFDIQAECRVTQVYTRKDLLLSILSNIAYYEPSELSKGDDYELADRLRKTLFTKRYLLIIDDVWDVKAWDHLWLCFRDTNNGSRIILTTRLQEVVDYAKCVSEPHHLRLLSEQECWLLLQKKVFGKEICSQELKEVGQQIAKKCKGLPLYVVLVAGLLGRIDKTKQWWKRVELRFGELIQVEANALVKLSYNHLPDILKPCLLYFGAISEGKEISVAKLTSLWIAEGFIKNVREKHLEDIAEHYLEDLIRRSLVMVVKRSNRKLKACRLHDQVLEFCKAKAKEDNFLLGLKRNYIANPPQFFSEKSSHRRLSFCSNGDGELTDWRPSCLHARTVLFGEVKNGTLPSLEHASIIFGSFKFLRVLDLEFVVVESFPTELNHLRYLAVQTTADSIPSSIENLPNLQTFIAKRTRGQQIHLPNNFWKLIKLRHASISDRASFNLHNAQESLDVSTSKLENLATLCYPYVSSAEDMERIVSKTPNLQKLKCVFADSWGWKKNENGFPVLHSLHRLETLKVHFFNFPKVGPSRLNFPMNLKKLTLSNFPLPHAEISTIAKLPNLEILKLQQVAFEREEWEVRDEDFPQLKLLKLENLKLSKWRASDEVFQSLRRLVVTRCLKLEALPLCFADLCSLEWIEVKSCNQSVADSVMAIRNTQVEDCGNDDFKVSIEL
ncbi:putative late blight resistance protein homolog R1C-3 [Nicotiana tabacum]|uniref:Late blight resistance protein homolog R1C-3 n=1 Tax=Nicotiana tabacum TaxID=4097 RepID=A0A1S4C3X6_TOBAC|nr:PREDICTED: putative late blight resistance protein homolog R1C-3 [Nicotiana tabacum]